MDIVNSAFPEPGKAGHRGTESAEFRGDGGGSTATIKYMRIAMNNVLIIRQH
jgi:hypothetical protein